MNDIKLGISKSRGYENVDLEEMCNKKTPQDGELKGDDKAVHFNVNGVKMCNFKSTRFKSLLPLKISDGVIRGVKFYKP